MKHFFTRILALTLIRSQELVNHFQFLKGNFIIACLGLGLDGLLKEGQTIAPDKFDNFTCGRIDLMGDIVTKSAPYLYPFLIEFSLIGAAVLMVMWARIGKNPR